MADIRTELATLRGIMTLTHPPCEIENMSLFQDLKLKRKKLDSRCSSDGESVPDLSPELPSPTSPYKMCESGRSPQSPDSTPNHSLENSNLDANSNLEDGLEMAENNCQQNGTHETQIVAVNGDCEPINGNTNGNCRSMISVIQISPQYRGLEMRSKSPVDKTERTAQSPTPRPHSLPTKTHLSANIKTESPCHSPLIEIHQEIKTQSNSPEPNRNAPNKEINAATATAALQTQFWVQNTRINGLKPEVIGGNLSPASILNIAGTNGLPNNGGGDMKPPMLPINYRANMQGSSPVRQTPTVIMGEAGGVRTMIWSVPNPIPIPIPSPAANNHVPVTHNDLSHNSQSSSASSSPSWFKSEENAAQMLLNLGQNSSLRIQKITTNNGNNTTNGSKSATNHLSSSRTTGLQQRNPQANTVPLNMERLWAEDLKPTPQQLQALNLSSQNFSSTSSSSSSSPSSSSPSSFTFNNIKKESVIFLNRNNAFSSSQAVQQRNTVSCHNSSNSAAGHSNSNGNHNGNGNGNANGNGNFNHQIQHSQHSTNNNTSHGNKGDNDGMDDDDQPMICMICEDKATGLHYGIITCEGCKGFFKRTVQNRRVYTCVADGTCEINKAQRNRCQYCRFKKCIEQGMVLQAVREDRMPGGRNSGAVYNLYKVKYKKHKKNPNRPQQPRQTEKIKTEPTHIKIEPKSVTTLITLKNEPINNSMSSSLSNSLSSLSSSSSSSSTSSSIHPHLVNGTILKTALTNPSEVIHLRQRLDTSVSSSRDRNYSLENSMNMIQALIDCDEFEDIATLPNINEFNDEKIDIAVKLCKIGDSIVYKLVQWAKRLPFYPELPLPMHTTLLTHKWHELLVLTTSAYQAIYGITKMYPDENEDYDFENEVEINLKVLQARLSSVMGRTISIDQLRHDVGHMVEKITQVTLMFKKIKLTMEEYVCLKVITMLNQDRSDSNGDGIITEMETIQERYMNCLRMYTQYTNPQHPTRFHELLIGIPEIQAAAVLLLESKMFYVPFLINTTIERQYRCS